MFCGNKKNIVKILPYVNEDLKKALEYIQTTDFDKVENGEYILDGEKLFARINTYATEPKANKKPESHNQYIDVQYLGKGEETIYFIPKSPEHIVSEDFSEERDLLFYKEANEKDCVRLSKGDFAIFFPWELHRPGCMTGAAPENVQKIVVKVRYK